VSPCRDTIGRLLASRSDQHFPCVVALTSPSTLAIAKFRTMQSNNKAHISVGERFVRVAIHLRGIFQGNEAPSHSDMQIRLMADSAPMMMWWSGVDKLVTFVNQGWLTFTGRTLQQELGDGWAEGVHPSDLHALLNAYKTAFDKRERFSLEYRLRRFDGQYRWIVDHGVPKFLENGEFAGYIGCCLDINDHKETKAALSELSGRLIRAQEEERSRIARDLHDDINQRMALLANGLQGFVQASDATYQNGQRPLRELWQLTTDIATDIQQISHRLHPTKLHYLGLGTAVRDLCQEFSKQHKIEVECVVVDLPRDLDDTVSLSLFRTTQESLRNIAKHSNAHHVKVELTRQGTRIRLRVSDDGIGFILDDPGAKHGLGLVSMRERLRAVEGDLSIWSRPSFGTQVEGTAPATVRRDRVV